MSVVPRRLTRADGSAGDGVVIAPMRRRDVRAALPIEQAAYPKPWSRSVFESEIAQVKDGTRYYVVARQGRSVVGYAGLWFVDDPDGAQAHVTNIVVDDARRREGIALRIMLHLARAAIDRGCVAWTLEVRVSSEGAQELYRRFGFAPAGVRKRYYENVEDAIVMWCHDLATDAYLDRLRTLEEAL